MDLPLPSVSLGFWHLRVDLSSAELGAAGLVILSPDKKWHVCMSGFPPLLTTIMALTLASPGSFHLSLGCCYTSPFLVSLSFLTPNQQNVLLATATRGYL